MGFSICPYINYNCVMLIRFTRFLFAGVIITLLSTGALYGKQASWMDGRSSPEDLLIQLVTIEPGDELYTWWGHAAIIVTDTRLNESRFYNYGLFSVALLISGFVRSKAALALLLISCAVTGPVVLFAGDKVAVLSREITLPRVDLVVTPIHIAGAVLFLIGLVAGIFMRGKKAEAM